MRERPLLMSGPMVRAILDGRKSVTRRVVKPQPPEDYGTIEVGRFHPTGWTRDGEEYPCAETFGAYTLDGECSWRCPYGEPGDRLWVRETWAGEESCVYRADSPNDDRSNIVRWRPSIHMPRWASRISLEVIEVRVERLQEITEEEAAAEGADPSLFREPGLSDGFEHRLSFAHLWDSLNDYRGYGWDANPWVWVIRFRALTSESAVEPEGSSGPEESAT